MRDDEAVVGSDGVAKSIRGRDTELARLREAVGALREGKSAHVVVIGEPGAGKSRLLDFVCEEARAASLTVALVRAGGIPSAGVAATLAEALSAPNVAAIDIATATQMDASVELRYWWVQELEAAIERLAQPVLVVIDDLQFADELTRLAARALPLRLRRSPVAWVIAQRTTDFEQRSVRGGSALSEDALVLPRLDEHAVVEVAADILGGAPDTEIRTLLAHADGLPLRVISYARELRDAGVTHVSEGVASLASDYAREREDFTDPVERRFGLLSSPARQVALSASVLGLQFTLTELLALTGQRAGQILEPVEELLRSGILHDSGGALEFEHEIVRSAAEAQLDDGKRNLLRRAAYALSRDESGRPTTLGQRALRAVEHTEVEEAGAPSRVEALAIVEDALTIVLDEDASLAADLIERRLQLLDVSGAGLRSAMADAIPVMLHAGRMAEARELARRGIAENMVPDEEIAARLALAQLTTLDEPRATRENLDVALRLPVSSPVLKARLAALSTRPYTTDYLYDALEQVLPRVRETVVAADDDLALSTFEHVEAIAAFHRHEWAFAREAISRAEERGQRTGGSETWFASLIRVSLLRCVGRPLDALLSIDREIRAADERRQALALLHLQLVRANILLDLGRLDEAEIQAEAVRELAEDIGAEWTVDVGAVSILAQIAVHRDTPDVMDRLGPAAFRFAQDKVAHQRLGGEWIELLLADISGDPTVIEMRTRGDHGRSRILGPPVGGASDVLDDVYFTRLVLENEMPERARKVERMARDRARITGAPIAQGVLDHVVGLIEGDLVLLETAAKAYNGINRPLAEAAAWEDLAVAQDVGHSEAVRALRRAHALLSSCDATRSLARVEGRLRDLGERPPVRVSTRNALGLTAAEQRIVDRAVRNETAAEIAASLYLSRNTVTAHLRRIYAKLDVRSRKQMIEVVRGSGLAPR